MAYKRQSPMPIAEGGTNAITMTNTDGVVYYTGSALATTGVGTATQVLTSNGAGVAPTFQNASGGGGITTLDGDGGGSATGSTVNLRLYNNSFSQIGGTGRFYASGDTVSFQYESFTNTEANPSIGVGFASLANIDTDTGNQANYALGVGALNTLTTGSLNIALGAYAGNGLVDGERNVVIGDNTGNNMGSGASNNIIIGVQSAGVPGSNYTRIGSYAGLDPITTSCTILGIFGSAVSGSGVLCDSDGNLGTIVSSMRFKENVAPMPDNYSEKIYDLEPKLFNYKTDPGTQAWGLIAEEVNQVFPELIVKDREGLPHSVKYHELPVLLLKEIIKLRLEINQLKGV